MPKIKCPICGSTNTIRIIYGLPAYDLFEKSQIGMIKLGGCCIIENNSPHRICSECKKEFDRINNSSLINEFKYLVRGFTRDSHIIAIKKDLNNNKWNFIHKMSKSYYSNVMEIENFNLAYDEYVKFSKRINNLYIEDWNDSYINNEIIDGTTWEVELKIDVMSTRNDVNEEIFIRKNGTNLYPIYYSKLLKILNGVFKEKIA